MKIASIKSKLLVICVVLVFAPLVIQGLISESKTSTAMHEQGRITVENTAVELALLIDSVLAEQVRIADVFASDSQVVAVTEFVATDGSNEGAQVKELYAKLRKQFSRMGSNYQGIFITDRKGYLYTGVLEGGKEYKGISVDQQEYFQRMNQ